MLRFGQIYSALIVCVAQSRHLRNDARCSGNKNGLSGVRNAFRSIFAVTMRQRSGQRARRPDFFNVSMVFQFYRSADLAPALALVLCPLHIRKYVEYALFIAVSRKNSVHAC